MATLMAVPVLGEWPSSVAWVAILIIATASIWPVVCPSCVADAVFDERSITATRSLLGRLPLEGLIAVAKGDPGLLAAGPNMPGRPQPGCVVQRPGTDADYAAARQAINPTRTLRANEARVEPSTVGHSLNRPRLARGAMECRLRQCDP